MLEAHSVAVRFQLELRAKYGREKANALSREIATRLPKDASVGDAEKYAAESRKAWHDPWRDFLLLVRRGEFDYLPWLLL